MKVVRIYYVVLIPKKGHSISWQIKVKTELAAHLFKMRIETGGLLYRWIIAKPTWRIKWKIDRRIREDIH